MKLGSYEFYREQGGIGAGTAWLARAGDGGAPLSGVRIHKHLVKKPESVEAFLAETRPAMGFRHPNVVALLEVGNEGGDVFAVSELADGEPLSSLLAGAGTAGLPIGVVLRIGLDVLAALAAAHGREPALVHGELGPHQVIVGVDGVARVAGLALSRALARLSPPLGAKNHERLSYAAPERVKAMASSSASAPAPEPRGDLFSVGVVLWEGLARQRLFGSKIEAAIVQKVLTGPIASLTTLPGAAVPPAIAAAVAGALERDPAKRSASAETLRAALEAAAAEVATAEQVAAEVERIAGKAIAARRPEGAAAGAPASAKPATSAPAPTSTPAVPKAASAGLSRKATLLGVMTKPAAKAPEVPAVAKPAEAPVEVKPPSQPKPAAEAKPQPRVDEGLEDEEPPVAAASAAKPMLSTKSTLRMGTAAVATPQAPAQAEEADKKAATYTARSFGDGAKPAPAQPKVVIAVAPKPAPAAALPETAGGKTAPTPGSDEASPSSRGRGVDKVGPGSTLGRYEILMPVARGGMASVWAAKLPGSRGFQKVFAIKTMLPDVSDDPDFENMFLDEGRVAARIRHPNVVEIIDLGEQNEVLYLVMEWVEGDNLGSLVKQARAIGGVPLPIVLKIASQIAAGLHAAHELRDDDGTLIDLVHRDISPANVLISTGGHVKIVDFGIAKSKGRLHQTRVGGVVKGKTPYLSPEQLGQLPIDRRSDIFSFGVLLYVLTTGLHPFRGETDTKTIENIALRDPVPLRSIVPTTPPEFETVVLRALAKDRNDRFTTAAEMQRAIDQSATSIGITTTEEDVAAFVRAALGDVLTKRAQDLRAAIDRAEGRTPAPEAEPVAPKPAEVAPAPVPAAAEVEAVQPPAEADEPPVEEPKVTAPFIAAVAEAAPAPPTPRPHFAVPPPPLDPEPAAPPPVAQPSRARAPSDGDGAPLEVPGVPKRRRPVLQIAVGAAVGVCAVIGVAALLTGGKKDPPTRRGTTAAPVETTAVTTPPAPTAPPAPTPSAAPTPTPTAAPAATAPPPDAAPSTAPSAPEPAAQPPGLGAPQPAGARPTTPPSKPPPRVGQPPAKKKFNPQEL